MPKRNLAWMLVVIVIALLLWQFPGVIAERDAVIRNFGAINEVRTDILRYYVREDEGLNQRLADSAVKAACEAMIAALGDPHARYFDPAESVVFEKRAEGLIGGIGADVAVVAGRLVIQNVADGTPASAVGLKRGDQIVMIEGQLVDRIGLLESVNLLAGEPSSEVHFSVVTPPGAPRPISLTRTVLQINPVRGWSRAASGAWRYVLDRTARIAYVRLIEFLPNAPVELERVIEPLLRDGVRGLILDLRENRGGRFEAAIDIADHFLDSGVIVSTKGRTSDRQEWTARPEGTFPNVQLVLLVNEWTASSAEIVAGALRDHRRAELVGERTYGKGSVQELFPVTGGGSIKITTRHYFLPSGVCIQKTGDGGEPWGVEPTIRAPLTPEQREAWLNKWLTGVWQTAATQPATTSSTADEAIAAAADLNAMIDADLQFATAYKYLRTRVVPASTQTAPGP